ncbi:MAG: alpha/beta fold hydrolase [Luteolibacter sp.]
MKLLGKGAMLAVLAVFAAANAQTSGETPLLKTEDLRKLLEDNSDDVSALAKSLLGTQDTNRLFYFPTHDEPATPSDWGFAYDNVNFKSADGTKLHGWFLKARADKPKGTVVFSHGNAGSIGHHLGFVMWLAEAGYQVFMYDYRGFGKSEGVVNREGMVQDVRAAFDYVVKRPDVDATKLISYGHSLGGAKSVTALARGKLKGLRAIIIDGTFSSYQAMARIMGGEIGASLITDDLSPCKCVKLITETPLLVIHGDQDNVVPLSQGKELYDLANQPKTFFEVKGGTHGNSLARDGGAYRKRMLTWLEEVM